MNSLPDIFVTFDLETLRFHNQVEGSWDNIEGFGMSCAVTHSKKDGYKHYFANDLPDLLEYLKDAPLVVGFNLKDFDYRVLAGAISDYLEDSPSPESVERLAKINLKEFKTFDILEEIQKSLGHKVRLAMMALANFGTRKTGNLKKAVDWWREGDKVKVSDYCQKDVEIARELFIKAVSKKHLLWHWWNHEDRVENLDTIHWGPRALSIMETEGVDEELESGLDISDILEITLSLELNMEMKHISGDGGMTHEQERVVLGLVESIQKNCEALKALGSPVDIINLEPSIKKKFGKRNLQ